MLTALKSIILCFLFSLAVLGTEPRTLLPTVELQPQPLHLRDKVLQQSPSWPWTCDSPGSTPTTLSSRLVLHIPSIVCFVVEWVLKNTSLDFVPANQTKVLMYHLSTQSWCEGKDPCSVCGSHHLTFHFVFYSCILSIFHTLSEDSFSICLFLLFCLVLYQIFVSVSTQYLST